MEPSRSRRRQPLPHADPPAANNPVASAASPTSTARTKLRRAGSSSPAPTPSIPPSPSPSPAPSLERPAPAAPVAPRRHRIAMVSDFFYPNMGGVELHLYQLSSCLLSRGNKVIMITHSYGNRKGVRYLTNGLKVYYLPQAGVYNKSSFPTLALSWYYPLLRNILIREQIDIVHCHQAFSVMALEGLLQGRTMGYKTVFTDHSLFGFADLSSIHTNKLLKFSLSDATHVVCVSNTSKENTVLRGSLNPSDVSVIPNAIDTTRFHPDPSKRDPNKITIVVMSRLVYRKGIDLLVEVIPPICAKYPQVHWIIGGDGPKRVDLEELREKHQLHERVDLLGEVQHSNVRNVLVRGDIFLNCSLTEAFCIAIVEAASCGLLVISTAVGGGAPSRFLHTTTHHHALRFLHSELTPVPEVLSPELALLAEPTTEDLLQKVEQAIPMVKDLDMWKTHHRVKECYSWYDVAARTEVVYSNIRNGIPLPLMERLRRLYGCGVYAGKLFCLIAIVTYLMWKFLEWWHPEDSIDIAPDFPHKKYRRRLESGVIDMPVELPWAPKFHRHPPQVSTFASGGSPLSSPLSSPMSSPFPSKKEMPAPPTTEAT